MSKRKRAKHSELNVAPPIAGTADLEYQTRIQAQQCTAQFNTPLAPIDGGKQPIDDSPLFGGDRQESLF